MKNILANKKGILTYDFIKNAKIEEKINIGDYIQSLAVKEIISEDIENLIFVEREAMNSKPKMLKENEKVKVIANGWYLHNNEGSFPIHDSIEPLFVSMHISNRFELNEKQIESLKKFEPIGCRDLDSVKKLNSKGIESYFTGCMTLTMKKRNVERKGIVFVVDNINGISTFEEFKSWNGSKKVIDELSKNYSISEIENAKFMAQSSPLELDILDQFKIAEDWLDQLSRAELVVTTRIHSLMPSMSMGTPALFIMLNNEDDRFKGLFKYWNYIDFTNHWKDGIVKNEKILYDENGKIKNNESFREDFNELKETVLKWWSKN